MVSLQLIREWFSRRSSDLGIETHRAGRLKKGLFVIYQGHFARLKTVSNNVAHLELLCYTAGTRESYDRSVKGSVVTASIDLFRAASPEEILEYLE